MFQSQDEKITRLSRYIRPILTPYEQIDHFRAYIAP